MSFKDKIQSWINVTEDEPEIIDEGFDFAPGMSDPEPEEQPEVRPQKSAFTRAKDRNSNVVNINSGKPAQTSKPRVVFQKIDRFADVNKVADILKTMRIVVLNLETCPNDEAQRIIDVLYGVSYANDGDFKKIADRAYIITPNNVPVSGELGDEITSAPEEEV